MNKYLFIGLVILFVIIIIVVVWSEGVKARNVDSLKLRRNVKLAVTMDDQSTRIYSFDESYSLNLLKNSMTLKLNLLELHICLMPLEFMLYLMIKTNLCQMSLKIYQIIETYT